MTVGVGVAVAGKACVGDADSVGVAVGVAVGVGKGVRVGVLVGVPVGVGVAVGVPVAVTVEVGVGIKKAIAWLVPRSTLGRRRNKPKMRPTAKNALPASRTYLPGGQSGNGAGSRSAPQVGHTR
jgi:hypothetical protein